MFFSEGKINSYQQWENAMGGMWRFCKFYLKIMPYLNFYLYLCTNFD